MTALAEVVGLTIRAPGGEPLVDGVSLAIERGEAVGLVGPSGCGKSTVALALLGHVRAGCTLTAGAVRLEGRDVFALAAPALQAIRGRRVALVPQDAGSALTPTMRVGSLIEEVLRHHGTAGPAGTAARALELLGSVNLPEPAVLARRHPHALSGGQRQRVAIALALAGQPDLLILDEPTTGLDATTRARVLKLLAELHSGTRTALLVISHDLPAVEALTSRTLRMSQGRLVPAPPTSTLPSAPTSTPSPTSTPTSALTITSLAASYPHHPPTLHDLTLTLPPATTLALVGESGSGKSTLARILAGLHSASSGTIRFGANDLLPPAEQRPRDLLRSIQIIFQNPDSSLNPRHTVAQLISRPLQLFFPGDAAQPIESLLAAVRLPARVLPLYPSQLSGGEKQRVAIARAFAARPAVVICDEVVSALDADARGAVLELLTSLQRQHGTAYLFITHDLALARDFADRVAVLYQGRLVEEGVASDVLAHPKADHTRQLLAAAQGEVLEE